MRILITQGIGICIVFTLAINTLLLFGLRKGRLFFDLFIGLFFWLGFWFKFSIRMAFLDGKFIIPVGNFDYSGAAHDHALLVSSCGVLALLIASRMREKYLFSYPGSIKKIGLKGLFNFYQKYRKLVWLVFATLFITVGLTNAYFGIYQRGVPPRTILPYGLNGVYTWLLLFGGASTSSLLLHFEFLLNKKTSYFIVALSILESFFPTCLC